MIVGTFSKIPKNLNNHSYGWAKTWSENLGVDIDHSNGYHKEVYLLPGANFGGSLNLFGGFTPELEAHINNLLKADKVTVLDYSETLNYGEMLAKRKDVTDKGWCQAIHDKMIEAHRLVSSDLPLTWLSVGDSHTAAYAPRASSVVKRDGTTLNGQIKTDFAYIRSHIGPHHEGITISLGNIDIRHHICRHGVNLREFLRPLIEFCNELSASGLKVEVNAPWPIEFEGRKLPKTGFFKDTPFFGSREERSQVVSEWIHILKDAQLDVVSAPEHWYSLDPEQYAKDMMERPQSVHLSPEKYRRNNWGNSLTLEGFF